MDTAQRRLTRFASTVKAIPRAACRVNDVGETVY
jgi:hypothetical protein